MPIETKKMRPAPALPLAGPCLLLLLALLLLGACSLTGVMTPARARKIPDSEHAVISFIKGPGDASVTLWRGERFLGILPRGGTLQCKLPPGKHFFVATHQQKYNLLIADIQAGKHYALLVDIAPLVGPEYFPLIGGKATAKLSDWFEKNKFLELAPDKRDSYDEAQLQLVKKYLERFKTGKRVQLRILSKEMSIEPPDRTAPADSPAKSPAKSPANTPAARNKR